MMKTRPVNDHQPCDTLTTKHPVWRNYLFLGAVLLCITIGLGCAIGPKRAKIDWTVADIPPQHGRIFLVTGGTSGIGYETARALAAAGAHVVIAARNADRGREAIASIREETPDARVTFETLDLADLASVRALRSRLDQTLPHLDGLINNAAVMNLPTRGTSPDGFEMQLATNYLGHFALTGELLPLLRKSDSPRVVTLSSIGAAYGEIQFDDLQFEQSYSPDQAYQQSKLACLMFALELQRRSNAEGWGIQSMASHPGLSRTNLQSNHGAIRRSLRVLFQTAEQGAVPTLYAATAPEAIGGGYYGPTGLLQARGPLGLAEVPAAASDVATSVRLWAASEQLTGVRYP